MSKSSICTLLAEASCCIDEDNKHTEAINNLIKQAREQQNTDNADIFDGGNNDEHDQPVNYRYSIL